MWTNHLFKLVLLTFIFASTFSCVKNGQNHPSIIDEEADRAFLTHLKEVDWPKAYREQDTSLLSQILADEFQMIDNAGNWSNKALEIDYVSKNKPSYDSFRFEIKRLDILDNGTAVVAGTGHVEGSDHKGPYQMTYQSSNILIKREGTWKAISSHVSGVKYE